MSVALDFATAPPAEPRRLRAVGPDAGAAARPASVTVLHAPGAAEVAAPLRLTRRGVVVLCLAVALLAGSLLAWARASAPAASTGGAVPGTLTVAPGDTLWSIATRVAPERDPRAEVAALERRNHLHGVDLVPGQRLRVP